MLIPEKECPTCERVLPTRMFRSKHGGNCSECRQCRKGKTRAAKRRAERNLGVAALDTARLARGVILCRLCGCEKPVAEFYPRQRRCKACVLARARNHPSYVARLVQSAAKKAEHAAIRQLRIELEPHHFDARGRPKATLSAGKFTVAQWDDQWRRQDGRCAFCGQPFDAPARGGKRLPIDHDHVTGTVRGIVHDTCNLRIAYCDAVRDDPDLWGRYEAYCERARNLVP